MQILAYLLILALIWLIGTLPTVTRFLFRIFCRYGVAAFVTPASHSRYGDCEKTEGYDSLVRGGFGIESWWASNSVAKMKKK